MPPNIICVQLNRFANDNITKLTRTILIDQELDLTNYTILQGNPTNYRLRSVICHEGETLSNGHHIAFGWTNNGFYEFNDEKVSPISDNDLKNKEAYLVFYEKYNPVSLEDTVDSSSIGNISESERMKPLRNNMETRKFLKRAYQSSTGSSFSKKNKIAEVPPKIFKATNSIPILNKREVSNIILNKKTRTKTTKIIYIKS